MKLIFLNPTVMFRYSIYHSINHSLVAAVNVFINFDFRN